jgi:hypothetical protein
LKVKKLTPAGFAVIAELAAVEVRRGVGAREGFARVNGLQHLNAPVGAFLRKLGIKGDEFRV